MHEEVRDAMTRGKGWDSLVRGGLVGLAAVALLASSCGSGGHTPGEPSDRVSSSSPSATRSTSASPRPGTVQVRDLSFAPPHGLTHVTDTSKQGNPKARYEMVGKAKPPLTPPVLDVFVENGDVGPLKVRAASIVDLLNLQLKNAKVVQNKPISVPGAIGARLIEVRFTCTAASGKGTFGCRQFEILVQRKREPQYGLRYGTPDKKYRKAEVHALVSSLRVG